MLPAHQLAPGAAFCREYYVLAQTSLYQMTILAQISCVESQKNTENTAIKTV